MMCRETTAVVVSFERHSCTVRAKCRGRSVKPSGIYSYRCAFNVNTLLSCVLFDDDDDDLAARKTAAAALCGTCQIIQLLLS